MALVTISSISAFFADELKQLRRGENSLSSQRLESFVFSADPNHLKAKVKASMKNRSYDVEGRYRCHHMAVVLLHAHKEISRTDQACKWVKKKMTEDVRSVCDLFPAAHNPTVTVRKVDDDDRRWFRDALQEVDGSQGFAWLLSSPATEKVQLSVPSVEDVLVDLLTAGFEGDICQAICEKIKVTQAQIWAVESATVGQAANPLWAICRKGRLTSSNFGPVVKLFQVGGGTRKPSQSLLKTLLGQYDVSGVHAVNWGMMHESTALKQYQERSGQNVSASGIWLNASGRLGASPDGIVNVNKIVEVKCPFSARSTSLKEVVLTKKKYFLKLDDGTLTLDTSDDTGFKYYHQIQGCMHFTGRQVCDLVIWTPQEMVVLPIVKDVAWSANITHLEDFYLNSFLPVFADGGVSN